MNPQTRQNVDQWLAGKYDQTTKTTIETLLKENPQEIVDAFYTKLSFGTGGMRGLMGVGSNRMNEYTVKSAAQGLANYLIKQGDENISVIIGYDSRHQSKFFAEESAKVLAANHIKVYLYKHLHPVALVSFGCRYYHCQAGIMITASHNPPQYNGFKVYWKDGAQILPPHDKGIIDEVYRIDDLCKIKSVEMPHPLINLVAEEIDAAYIQAFEALQYFPEDNRQHGSELQILYSNLHGTGITMLPQTLASWGFTNLSFVEEQKEPDGSFPTVHSPNPEERSALQLGIDQLLKVKADLLLATDPDADRLGVVVNHHGMAEILTGNEIACLCLEHILQAGKQQKELPKRSAFVKTIVTTELFKSISEAYGYPCFDVLTGFKYIAEKIGEWQSDPEGYQYIFGGEESFGYLLGTFVRDKDAISSSALVCEVALQAKLQNKTLVDRLHDIFNKYGVYRDKLFSINFKESKEGKEKMEAAMISLRKDIPKELCGILITAMEDYESSIKTDLINGKQEKLKLPKSNVLLFWFEDGSKLVVRPSGTEPKVKVYCGTIERNFASVPEGIKRCDARAEALIQALTNIVA